MGIRQLKSLHLKGVLIQRFGGKDAEYSLITPEGSEYEILNDPHWSKTLQTFAWQQVHVLGLLDFHERRVIPEDIYPDDSEMENSKLLEKKEKFKKFFQHYLGELIFVPAALCAVFGALNF